MVASEYLKGVPTKLFHCVSPGENGNIREILSVPPWRILSRVVTKDLPFSHFKTAKKSHSSEFTHHPFSHCFSSFLKAVNSQVDSSSDGSPDTLGKPRGGNKLLADRISDKAWVNLDFPQNNGKGHGRGLPL